MEWFDRCSGWVHDDKNIKGFFGDYRFLSNYHICPVIYEDIPYTSTEAAYQAAKCFNMDDKKQFQYLSPSRAKSVGQLVTLRDDWDDAKLSVMFDICYDKFTRNKDLQELLLKTGDKYLEETNWWKDQFWGVCDGKGKNHLGHILMMIRAHLNADKRNS